LVKDIVHSRQNRECLTGREDMPKIKTKRGAAKRFKKTGSGKIIRSKAFGNHILTKKTTKRKRSIRKSGVLNSANVKSVSRLIPYM
jgi:large subunit ribosomal protein L35